MLVYVLDVATEARLVLFSRFFISNYLAQILPLCLELPLLLVIANRANKCHASSARINVITITIVLLISHILRHLAQLANQQSFCLN